MLASTHYSGIDSVGFELSLASLFSVLSVAAMFDALPLVGIYVVLLYFSITVIAAVLRAASDAWTDPLVWFPPATVFFCGGIVVSTVVWNYSAWFHSVDLIATRSYRPLIVVLTWGLAGIYCGLAAGRFISARTDSGISLIVPSRSALRLVALGTTLLATTLLWIVVLNTGVIDWFTGTYGQGQWNRGGNYYLRLAAELLWFPSLALVVTSYLPNTRVNWWGLFLLTAPFLGPYLLWGSRSVLLFTIIVIFVGLTYHQITRFSIVTIVGSALATTSAFVLITTWRNTRRWSELMSLEFSPVAYLIRPTVAVGGITSWVIEHYPQVYDYLYGGSLWATVQNLAPSFIFSGDRPAMVPNIFFKMQFAPGLEGQGFGYSAIAEGYMNGGILGVFLFLAGISVFISLLYRATSSSTPLLVALYSILVYRSIWFLRSDSLAFVKGTLYGFAVLVSVVTGAHLVEKATAPSSRNSNL